MTDNEIIKAFECCEANEGNRPNCKECPWFWLEEKPVDCHKQVRKNAIDLINRQKAEIERLQGVQVQYVKAYFDEFAERLKNDFRLAQLDIGLMNAIVDELVDTMNNEFNTLTDFTDLIKAEAIKEFAERLKETPSDKKYKLFVTKEDIDNLVKEMVGEG